MTLDQEMQDGVEKIYKQGGRALREQYRKDDREAELAVMLTNGLIVELV